MKKIAIIGVGAFGFALLHHLSKNHPNKHFYAFEKNDIVLSHLKTTRQSPYFFSGVSLGNNIDFLDNYERLGDFDIILLAIPAQFIGDFFIENRHLFKSRVVFVNLSKGIDVITMQTPSDILKNMLPELSYEYAVLSGGMIAQELVDGNKLGAHIACENTSIGQELKALFESEKLQISLGVDLKNTELFGSIKNIFALYLGYLEGSGNGMSTIGYYFCELYRELPLLLKELGGEQQIDFSSFALGGDLIATCFGNSRNRYFGKLVGEGMKVSQVEAKLKEEKKHAEGYYTLQSISNIIIQNPQMKYFQNIVKIFQVH